MASHYPQAMTGPRVVWVPVLLTEDEEHQIYQGGAFSDELEAQKVLDVWRAEGRREPMAINVITCYDTADEWEADR